MTIIPEPPHLTRRHYQWLAYILSAYPTSTKQEKERLCRYFADELCDTNPRFAYNKFLEACK